MRKIITDWDTIFVLLMVCSTLEKPLLHYTNEEIINASVAVMRTSTIILFTFNDDTYVSYRLNPTILMSRRHIDE